MLAVGLARFLGLRCQVCGRPAEDNGLTCPDCAEELRPRSAGYCPACGMLFSDGNEEPHLCGRCLKNPMPWDAFAFYGPYEGLLGDLIRDYKFNSRLGLSRLLSSCLVSAAQRRGLAPELIVPVPLHARRLRERGFNQSLELARPLASALGARLFPEALERTRFTTPQVKLKAGQRRENVKGAFTANQGRIKGRGVLLVDDIMTTGGTLLECCKVLRKAGAARVEVLVLARTE